MAKRNGYRVVTNRSAFMALRPGAGKVFAYNAVLDGDKALPYELDRDATDLSLADYTAKAIELLDNPRGFSIMAEGGKIDWACHANDATASIHDTLAFDEAVREAVQFYNQHPDETLIVVTGDHECGGMTLGFAETKYESSFAILAKQRRSVTDFELNQIESALMRSVGGDKVQANDQETYLLYGGYDPLSVTLSHILNQKAGIGWTSYSHTAVPVPTFALGVGAGMFNGCYDNTDIGLKVMEIMNVSEMVAMN